MGREQSMLTRVLKRAARRSMGELDCTVCCHSRTVPRQVPTMSPAVSFRFDSSIVLEKTSRPRQSPEHHKLGCPSLPLGLAPGSVYGHNGSGTQCPCRGSNGESNSAAKTISGIPGLVVSFPGQGKHCPTSSASPSAPLPTSFSESLSTPVTAAAA